MVSAKNCTGSIGLTLLSFTLLLILFACGEVKQQTGPPPEILVTEALKMDVPVTGEWIGQTLGAVDIEIRAKVEGWLTSIYFMECSEVQKGAFLYTNDATELREAVAAGVIDALASLDLEYPEDGESKLKELAEAKKNY